MRAGCSGLPQAREHGPGLIGRLPDGLCWGRDESVGGGDEGWGCAAFVVELEAASRLPCCAARAPKPSLMTGCRREAMRLYSSSMGSPGFWRVQNCFGREGLQREGWRRTAAQGGAGAGTVWRGNLGAVVVGARGQDVSERMPVHVPDVAVGRLFQASQVALDPNDRRGWGWVVVVSEMPARGRGVLPRVASSLSALSLGVPNLPIVQVACAATAGKHVVVHGMPRKACERGEYGGARGVWEKVSGHGHGERPAAKQRPRSLLFTSCSCARNTCASFIARMSNSLILWMKKRMPKRMTKGGD